MILFDKGIFIFRDLYSRRIENKSVFVNVKYILLYGFMFFF